jgi:hypothetical protein
VPSAFSLKKALLLIKNLEKRAKVALRCARAAPRQFLAVGPGLGVDDAANFAPRRGFRNDFAGDNSLLLGNSGPFA